MRRCRRLLPFGRHERRRALSVRLLSLFLVTGILVVVVIGFMFGGAWRYRFEDQVVPHLEQYVAYLRADIGVPPDLEAAARLARDLPVDIAISGEGVRWSSLPTYPDENSLLFDHEHRIGSGVVQIGEYGRRGYVARWNSDGFDVLFLAEAATLDDRGAPARWLTIVLVLLILGGVFYLIRRMLRPIEALDDAVARFGAGDLDARANIRRRDELGALASSFNRMANEIQLMLEAKRELLLAISHELRSPLTRANVSTALVEDPERRRQLQHDLDEMEKLIGELLEAERLNVRHAPLNLEQVPLDELVAELVREQFAAQPLQLQIRGSPIMMRLDAVRISLMLRNLLDNALRHNRGNRGPVVLAIEPEPDHVTISVTDHGEGFSEPELELAGEAFWRRDRGRSRTRGGFGLGLYLARRIAQAHGGDLQIESRAGEGARISVSIPRDAQSRSTR